MILGSIITSIISPFANVFGQVLAFFYGFTHSYGLSIILLTLAVMLVVFPLTRAGTRSMMRMQILQPELKKIQSKYKSQPSMTTEEKQANRAKLNEEMMALYRENGVNPTGGCLPMFLQFPVFIVLYDTIRGMTRTISVGKGAHAHTILSPQYIPRHSALYNAVIHSHGALSFLGLNLSASVRSPGGLASKIPYVVVILIAVLLQYVSIWQITTRNPAAQQANPQMQAIQKFMPLIFVIFYIVLPAGVGLYFIVSSLFRIGQQEYMYKHDPKIQESLKQIRKIREAQAKVPKPPPSGPANRRTAALTPSAGGGGRGTSTATAVAKVGGSGGGARAADVVEQRKGLRERLKDAAAGLRGELPAGEVPAASRARDTTGAAARNGAVANPADRARSARNGSQPSKPPPDASTAVPRNRARAKRPRRP